MKRNLLSRKEGQSLIEVLIAMVVGTIMILAAITIIVPALKSNTDVARTQVAIALGKELLENVRVFGEANWSNISTLSTSSSNHHYLNAASSPFSAVAGDETLVVSSSTYNRHFYLDDVKRDGSGNVVLSGGTADPSTKKITVVYSWPNGPTQSVATYLTRSRNNIFSQTDWSGGGGQNGPATSVGSAFATSSNVSFTSTTGSIIINL